MLDLFKIDFFKLQSLQYAYFDQKNMSNRLVHFWPTFLPLLAKISMLIENATNANSPMLKNKQISSQLSEPSPVLSYLDLPVPHPSECLSRNDINVGHLYPLNCDLTISPGIILN